MTEPTPAARVTLRHLPLPAKLVVTCFLLAVGVGYSSAMVQIHMQHSDRDGATLPTVANVIAVFSGKTKWVADGGPRAPSRLEEIISGPPKGGLTAKNMTPAFFDKDEADYAKTAKEHPEKVAQLDADRDGERQAVIAWITAPDEARKTAYDTNSFALPRDRAKAPISDAYKDKTKPGTVLVKYILRDRCARCHQPGGEKGDIPLSTYEELAKYMPAKAAAPDADGWVDSGKQISLEKLTQSTHAHLLSFAVLFGLTGLTFAFTSYPGVVRGTLGPVVLVAQVADVACWWLARTPDVGPYFAMAILGTGGIVGMGLSAQIVLSLFNMYGPKGKVVLGGLFLLGAGLGGLAWVKVIDPYLKGEKEKAAAKADAAKKQADEEKARPAAKDDEKAAPKKGENGNPPAVPAGPSLLERQLTGAWEKGLWPKGNDIPDGAMVRAFFDKESEFKDALKEKDKTPAAMKAFQELVAEREGERAVVLAWIKADPATRKKAYEEDKFPLPPAMKDKPMTAAFVANEKAVSVKSLLEARCASCHGGENKVPLDGYDKLEKYLVPKK